MAPKSKSEVKIVDRADPKLVASNSDSDRAWEISEQERRNRQRIAFEANIGYLSQQRRDAHASREAQRGKAAAERQKKK